MTRRLHSATHTYLQPAISSASPITCWLLEGAVQGRGLRPTAVDLAHQLTLNGWICNTAHGVILAIHGPHHLHNELLDRLTQQFSGTTTPLPVPDSSLSTDNQRIEPALRPFHIRQSSDLSPSELSWLNSACLLLPTACHPGPAVPPDLAICSHCLSEIEQPNHPRLNYPLNSCLHCGPRYSVIRNMPWDRANTALENWPLCPDCSHEYHSLSNHRSHAQIINCPRCGPQLLALTASNDKHPPTAPNEQLIQHAAECLRQNRILAIQGIGGWQLICNAASSPAVQRLREIKQRPHKPLAVMIPSPDCLNKPLSTAELQALNSPQNPILICSARLNSPIAPNVRDPLRSIGIFLPSTALHHLIFRHFNHPVVVSSANVEDDPILYSHADAKQHLQHAADFLLGHQRTILRPVDDSVVRIIAGQSTIIRLARGFAPLPLPLSTSRKPAQNHTIVALGGHQKAAFAIAGNGRAVLGPHIGDLSSEAARLRFLQQLHETLELYQLQHPTLLVHDQHPDYFTTAWARSLQLPTIAVQHHHAHAAAALVGADTNTTALAAVFDGSGYSPDGVIRGSEFLIASHSSVQPAACLLPFKLPAPDIAAREPWRSAVALIHHALPACSAVEIARCFNQRPCSHHNGTSPDAADIQPLLNALDAGAGTPCTSMGRLFDALACIILGTHTNPFEAAAAILLEEAAADFASTDPQFARFPPTPKPFASPAQTPMPLIPLILPIHATSSHHTTYESTATAADWRPLIRYIVCAAEQGRAAADLARIVHQAIARLVLDVSSQYPHLPVALSGGCFQNRLLTEFTLDLLHSHQRQSLPPNQIPVNDGGLAAGQLAIACHNADFASPVN